MENLMEYIYCDGGRSKYFKGKSRDCVCRAIAIASNRDYKEVYDSLKKALGTPRNGVFTQKKAFKDWMVANGFVWTPCSGIGVKTSVHFVKGELPTGRMVCSVAKHYVAVVDDKVYDTWDSRYNSFNDLRRIYGYWEYKGIS
jgi:hypothetical protein